MSSGNQDMVRRINTNSYRTKLQTLRYDPNRAVETLEALIEQLREKKDGFPPDEWRAFVDLTEELQSDLWAIENGDALADDPDARRDAVHQRILKFFRAIEDIDSVVYLGYKTLYNGGVKRGSSLSKGLDLDRLTLEPPQAAMIGPAGPETDWRGVPSEVEIAEETWAENDWAEEIQESVQAEESTTPGFAWEQPATNARPYFTKVDFPESIQSRSTAAHPLIVQLVVNRPQVSRVEGAVRVQFKDKRKPEMLQIKVSADGFTEETACWHRTVALFDGQDSQPAVFLLKLADPAPQTRYITVDFYHDGRNVGSFIFATEVTPFAQQTRSSQESGPPKPDVSGELPPVIGSAKVVRAVDGIRLGAQSQIPAADVELRIHTSEQRLRFTLHSGAGYGGYHHREMGSVKLASLSAPSQLMDSRFERYTYMARQGIDLDATVEDQFLNEIKDDGYDLYKDLFSPELKQEYWNLLALRDQIRADEKRTMSLLIMSDEPWIPWEMVMPYESDDQSSGFLAEEFYLSRWLAGAGPLSHTQITSARLIAPKLDLDFVKEERKLFDGFTKRGVNVGAPIRTTDEFFQMAKDSPVQIVHFATHASFDSHSPEESAIKLEDGNLVPRNLTRRRASGLAQSRPIMFINACESGRIGLDLTGMGGWAQQAMDEVKAMAFIGSHWEIHDELAALFSQTFYTTLTQPGSTLGSAFHAARLAVRDREPGNPTWLAYVLYGDPNSEVGWGGERD